MIKKLTRMFVATLLVVALMLPIAAQGAVTQFPDIRGHWGEENINNWLRIGLVGGLHDGTFGPDKIVNKAEFISFLNRAFGYTAEATISFSDVKPDDWSYREVARAIQAGYTSGYADGTFRPYGSVNRLEAAEMLYKAYKLNLSEFEDALVGYTDTVTLTAEQRRAVNAVVSKNLMVGAGGKFSPERNITRAETIAILDRAAGEIFNKVGEYGPAEGQLIVAKNATVSVPGVTLRNMSIKGDLYLTEGIGDGEVTLHNVVVTGSTIVAGGGANSVEFTGTTVVPHVIITDPNGVVRIVYLDDSSSEFLEWHSGGTYEGGQGSTSVSLSSNIPAGSTVQLVGNFTNISLNAPDVTVTMGEGSTADEVTVGSTAQGSTLTLTGSTVTNLNVLAPANLDVGEGSSVGTLTTTDGAAGSSVTLEGSVGTLNANAPLSVAGDGGITNANINSGGVILEQEPENLNVAPQITASVGGEEVEGSDDIVVPDDDVPLGPITPHIPVTGITVTPSSMTLGLGQSQEITAKVYPDNAANSAVTWFSSNTAVATVINGVVTPVSAGTATVMANTVDRGFTATTQVFVVDKVIATVAELEAAIRAQADGQIWYIKNGTYDHGRFDDLTVSGQTGWYFPITANNLTIIGESRQGTIITSTVQSANGAWASQDHVSVWGNGVTISNLTIKPKITTNKTIEVMGKDFSLRNVSFVQRDEAPYQFAGSLYFNPQNAQKDIGSALVDNVLINDAWISCGSTVVTAGTLTLSDTTIDFRGSAYAPYGYGVISKNDAVIRVQPGSNFTVYVDDTMLNVQAHAIDRMPQGGSIVLKQGTYYVTAPLNVPSGVLVDSSQATINVVTAVVDSDATLRTALANASDDGTSVIVSKGTFTATNTNPITISKKVRLLGVGATINVSTGNQPISINANGTILEGFTITKTDKASQDIIYINANDVIIRNNTISGQYQFGDGHVDRAMLGVSGKTGMLVEGNTISNLRQPAYFNGGNTGTVRANAVTNTRGWVVCGDSQMVFTNNTFGTNAVDIAIIPNANTINNYGTTSGEIEALSAANNGAYVENQLSNISAKNGQLYRTAYIGGTYFRTVQAAVTAAVPGDTIRVAPGSYTDVLNISKSLTLLGPNTGTAGYLTRSSEAVIQNAQIIVSGANTVVIDGFHIYQTNTTADAILLGDPSTVVVKNSIIERRGEATGTIARGITTSAGTGAKTIKDNLFTGDTSGGLFGGHKTWQSGIYINGQNSTVSIEGNVFENCRAAANLDDFGSGITLSGNTFENNGTHLSFGGTAPTNGQYALGANDFKAPASAIINLSNVATTFRLDITSSTYNAVPFSALPLNDLFAIEAGMYHRGRSGKNGLAYYVDHTQYVIQANPSIQAAIDAASSGDTIRVAAGQYTLAAALNINKAVTVIGASRDTVVLQGASNIGTTVNLTNGATLKGVTVTRDNTGVWASNVNNSLVAFGQNLSAVTTLEDCIVKFGRNGVYLNNTSNAVIKANLVDNNRTGIQMANSVSALVEGNTITNNHTMGVLLQYLSANNYDIPTFTNNTIQNNWYSDFENRWPTAYVVNLSGNTFTDASIRIASSSGEPGYNDLQPVELGGTAVRPATRTTFIMALDGNLLLP